MPTTRSVGAGDPSRLVPPAGLLALLVLLSLACPGRLQAEDDVIPQAAPVVAGEPRAKIDSLIRAYIDLPLGAQGIDARLRSLTVPASRADRVRVRLDVVVTAQALALIAATGAQVLSSAARWNVVVVEATMAQIDALARLPEVRLIAAALRPRHHASSGTTTQPGTYVDGSAAVIDTNQVRTTYNVTGAGRTIGIMSDSINASATVGAGSVTSGTPQVLTNTLAQQSGNLPPSVLLCNNTNLSGSTDEGEAMMEGAYHLAPGATFAFSPSGSVDTDMAGNIGLLKSQAGCSVICDDIIFFDEPMFQDGPIAQAADAFVQGGGIYLTAAGNNANFGILTTYTPISASNTYHNWGTSGSPVEFLPLTIPSGYTVYIILEWNQPYQSYGLGPGSSSDFNLYLYKSASTSKLITSSTTAQGKAGAPSGDPFEFLSWKSSGATVYLAVDYKQGVNTNQVMRVVVFTDGPQVTGNTLLTFGTSYGHQTVNSVLTMAATDVSIQPQVVENFSAFGGWGTAGLPYYFDTTGAPLAGAPVLRNKPDLTAPDGVTCWNANFQPFYGTSDATPHGAAAAALAWCAQPTLSNTQIIAGLRASASPIANRATFVSGGTAAIGAAPNGWCGYGLVNAIGAVGATTTSVSSLTTTDANGVYTGGTIPIQVTFTNPVTVSGTPAFALDTSPPESAVYQSGSGTATLTFLYAIQPGDTAAALDAGSGAAISGGTIASTNPNATTLVLALPAAGTVGSLSAGAAIQIAAPRSSQTITFPAIASQVYGAGALALTATASSTLAPVFSVLSGPATVSGSTLTITGVGTVTVAANQPGDANYLPAPQVTQSFTVTPVPATIGVPVATTDIYNGSPQAVVLTLSDATPANADVTYQPLTGAPAAGGTLAGSPTSTAPTDVGWYQVVATLDANHGGGSASGTLQITPATVTVSAVSQSVAYGTAQVSLGFAYGAFQGSDTSAVVSGTPGESTTWTPASAVGSYPITVTLSGVAAANYTFTPVNGTLTVTPVIDQVSVPPATTVVYAATAQSVPPTIGGALSATATATMTYQPLTGAPAAGGTLAGSPTTTAPTDVGWYQVVATLDANHGGGSASGTLQITPATVTVSAVSQSVAYGTAQVSLGFAYGAFQGSDTSAVVSGTPGESTTWTPASAVGSYPITVTLSGVAAANYTFTPVNGTLTVTPVIDQVSVPPATTVVYAATAQSVPPTIGGALSATATARVTYQPLTGAPAAGGTLAGSPTTTAPTDVGWYQVVATLDANHGGGSASGTLQITPATVTVSAVSQSVAYGTAQVSLGFAYGAFQGSDTSAVVSGTPGESTTWTPASAVGSYPITVTLSGVAAANYTFTPVNGTLTVTPVIDQVGVPPATTVVYAATAQSVPPTIGGALSATATATVTYQPLTGAPAAGGTLAGSPTTTAPTDVGWYQVVATLDANHGGGSASGTLQITPATVTVSAVSQSVAYGAAPAPLSFTFGPFQGPDTSAVVSGAPVLSTTAAAGSPVGSYAISVAIGTLTAADYTFVTVNGTLTIGLDTQTITFAAIAAQTVGTPLTLSASASSGLPVAFSVLSGPATVSGAVLTFSAAGTVVVAADQAGNAGYLAAPEVTQSISVAAAGGGAPGGGTANAATASSSSSSASSGGGSHCGLGSGAAAALAAAFALCRLLPLRRRR